MQKLLKITCTTVVLTAAISLIFALSRDILLQKIYSPKTLKITKISTELPLKKPIICITQVNIYNLQQIKYIGEKKAIAIVKAHQEGKLHSKDDILKIKGIGKKNSQYLLQYIDLGC